MTGDGHAGRDVPWLIFDGDCGFCTSSAAWIGERLRRHGGPNARLVPWQFTDLAGLGITAERARREALWVTPDGEVVGGAAAFARWLRFRGGAYAGAGRLMEAPVLRTLAAAVYQLVAKNRHRMPGGTPACVSQPERSGGWMSGLRDYDEWHREYDDPGSDLSWRLGRVQSHLEEALDRHAGPCRIVSACSGDGRDVIEVLTRRDDADRVRAVLLELHPGIADRARAAAAAAGLAQVEVRTVDAGRTEAYLGAVPAEIVLLVGIFGNISDEDVWRTIEAAPQLCAPGAILLWSRGREEEDINAEVRTRFSAAGFLELAYETLDRDGWPALGVVRYDGPPVDLVPGKPLFTFIR